MVAFVNIQGGTLLIGISDDGSIKGVQDGENYEEYFSNIARNNIIPALDVTTDILTIDKNYCG